MLPELPREEDFEPPWPDAPPPGDEDNHGDGGGLERAAPFAVRYLSDEPPRPTDWLINGVIAEETCTLLAAQQKAGKTWWTWLLGLCLATGRPFFGRTVTRRAKTLYYTPESGWNARRRRTWGMCLALGLDPNEVLPSMPVVAERMSLKIEEHVDRLRATVQQYNPSLVIVDPFVAVAAGIEENSAGEVQPVLDVLRDVTAGPGRSLVLAHHHNKGGGGGTLMDSPRGSSAFGGWWDTLVSIRRTSTEWDCSRRVDIEHRDDPAPPPWGFDIVAAAHPEAPEGCMAYRLDQIEAPEVTSARGRHNSAAADRRTEDAFRLLSGKPGITVAQLATEMQVAPRTIRRYLSKLEADKRIRKEGNHVFPK